MSNHIGELEQLAIQYKRKGWNVVSKSVNCNLLNGFSGEIHYSEQSFQSLQMVPKESGQKNGIYNLTMNNQHII